MRLFKKVVSLFFAFVVFGLVVSPPSAMAAPIIPPTVIGHIFVQSPTTPVAVTILSAHTGGIFVAFDDIALVVPPVFLFNTDPASPAFTPIGTTISLGLFSAGKELEFSLTRPDPAAPAGSVTFFSGATPNPDGKIHASLDTSGPTITTTGAAFPVGSTVVYFEGGDVAAGDDDYEDVVFSVSNTAATAPAGGVVPVPEPATFLLVSMGLGAMILRRRA